MADFPDSLAWLAIPGGGVVAGYGPFEAVAAPPSDGVAFYLQDFALNDPLPWKIPARVERLTPREMSARHSDAPPVEIAWDASDAGPFSVVFQEIVAEIHAGTFVKTVPVVTEPGTANQPPGPSLVAAMCRQSAPLHSYGWVENGAGHAGATPEVLFSLRGNCLQTMALAGTARSEDRDVFAADEKEIREHQFVAQALTSKLVGLGQLRTGPRQILNLGPIVHFLTEIEVELESAQSPADLLRRLHPTPALGPLPRNDQTMQMLLDWRQRLDCPVRFGAPFGVWDHGEFHAVVAIRGIWWHDRNVLLPAGCGIIEASRLVNEWRELRLKREAVKRFLRLP